MRINKKGFSLVEILFVIVAIGFILIMGVNVLNGKINEYANPYYTAYNALRRATYNVLADIYCPDCFTNTPDNEFNDPKCKNGCTTIEECKAQGHICPDFPRLFPTTTEEMCTRLAEFLNVSENKCDTAGVINHKADNFSDDTMKLRTTNGQKIYLSSYKNVQDPTGKNLGFFVVYVDLNGNKSPNRITCADDSELYPDIAPFVITQRGDIIPIGYPARTKTYLTATVKYPQAGLNATSDGNPNDSARMAYHDATVNAWPSETANIPFRTENIPYSLSFDIYGYEPQDLESNIGTPVPNSHLKDSNITQCYRNKIASFNETSGTVSITDPNTGCQGGNYTCRTSIDKFSTTRY